MIPFCAQAKLTTMNAHFAGQSSLPENCPVCDHTPLDGSLCKPNKALRTTLKAFLRTEEKKRERVRPPPLQQQQRQQQQQQPTPTPPPAAHVPPTPSEDSSNQQPPNGAASHEENWNAADSSAQVANTNGDYQQSGFDDAAAANAAHTTVEVTPSVPTEPDSGADPDGGTFQGEEVCCFHTNTLVFNDTDGVTSRLNPPSQPQKAVRPVNNIPRHPMTKRQLHMSSILRPREEMLPTGRRSRRLNNHTRTVCSSLRTTTLTTTTTWAGRVPQTTTR